jgi:hypothetical protein
MYLVVQANDINEVDKIASKRYDEIRIGAEFCENKMLSLDEIINITERLKKVGKNISVVYPRLTNAKMDEVKEQLNYLNSITKEIKVIANDIGILNWVNKNKLTNLKVYFGRQLISVPRRARPPMPKIMGKENMLSKFVDKRLFDKTNLNYDLTLDSLKENSVAGLEVDYIPDTFPQLNVFLKNKLKINIHLGNVFVAVTRKCHTARHCGADYGCCGKICREKKFILNHEGTGTLYLDGNTIFDYCKVDEADFKKIKRINDCSLILGNKWIAEYKKDTFINSLI